MDVVSRGWREFFAFPRTNASFRHQVSGIGICLALEPGGLQTTRLVEGSPAAPFCSLRLTWIENTRAAIQTATIKM
jgi:hypothetical protein